MRRAATYLLVMSLVTPAAAQQAEPALAPPTQPATHAPTVPRALSVAPAQETIDATKLGVSLSRIQKALRTQPATQTQSGTPLRLEFQVQVYGAAPEIDVFKDFDLLHGAVPGSAPSHQQMIDFWTPQAFSAPTAPFLAMAYWATQQLWKKSKKTACEEEIARYRATLMQGIPVSAPRCTQ